MPRVALILRTVCLALALAGCQLTGSGGPDAPQDVTPNAVAGDAIEVTALDSPAPADAAAPPDPALTDAAADPAARAQPDPAAAADPAPVAAGEPAPKADPVEAAPETPKSEQQRACEKKGGKWARTGKGDFRICVYSTKDAGKQCTRESQCDGVCLARSGTCSPLKPLIGCNEILQDNGARVTLCIE